MKRIKLGWINFMAVLVMGVCFQAVANNEETEFKELVSSPDGNYTFSLSQVKDVEGKKALLYKVNYKGNPIILESELAFKIDNHLFEAALAQKQERLENWFENIDLINVSSKTSDTSWKPVHGERSEIRDHYNEAIFSFEKQDYEAYKVDLVVRAYDEGIAFRFYFVENPLCIYYHIVEENVAFTLPENTKAWYAPYAQAENKLLPLEDWDDESERPLTLQLANGMYACIAEAAQIDYARTKFKLASDKENTLMTSIYSSVDLVSPFFTPWRVIMAAEKPGELVENNFIIQNLNDPNAIEDPSWIKPGKIMREVTLTTEGAKASIDFAADHNMQYILFDWKWYGPSFTFDSDARTVEVDIDMEEVIAYGKSKDVGVWVYVNQQALQKQADEIFPLYHEWGLKGVKFGFVNFASQHWSTWLHETIRKAAENELMVNIHDEYRPTGFERTYPNLLTSEGIRGNEEFPTATHNTILPFTRQIAGAGDYTICYYDKRIKTTHAHQLALGVVYYSPLQTLFWYDKPSDYQGEPEIEFFENLPTTWDDTKILKGEIGEYVATARKSGNEWFVGIITGDDARTMEISFDFLDKGKKYIATIYQDDDKINTRTKVSLKKMKLTNKSEVEMKLKASGGAAIWIRQQ